MNIRQVRDLTVLDFDKERFLGISCDSCGGIGLKEHDFVKASPQLVAYQTGKVALAELMSMGFTPIVLANGLAVEMHDTGEQLIEGFNQLLSKLKTNKVHLTGSTEENIKTVQTSMGVTCMGICSKDKLKYKKTLPGDVCLLLGIPLIGDDVVNNPDKILEIDDFEKLYLCDYIKEMLPVGSRGIAAELNDLCDCNNLNIKLNENISENFLNCSGGPSCSCLITTEERYIDIISALVDKPFNFIGKFKNRHL